MIERYVSIIMPNYNNGRFIGSAIESVIAQTYKNWEMIIVDDCSSDNSIEIIKKYQDRDPRIRLFSTESPSGSPVKPRNIGIEKAKGRYIAFLDSDDLWLPDKLECQIKLFDNRNVAIVYSNYEKITETGTRNGRVINSPEHLDYKQLLKGNSIGCLTAVYDVLKVEKIFFSKFYHEDYVLWLTVLRLGYIASNINKVGALYRVRQNSVSSKKLKVLKWQWDIYRKYLKFNFCKAIFYFCFYAVNGFLKFLK
ncbi:glycosyl transferase [Spirochaetia bacterium]|nr:glycosyl transferase [Spirochaetia bacterium]